MSLIGTTHPLVAVSFPRVSGDEPHICKEPGQRIKFSPRERG